MINEELIHNEVDAVNSGDNKSFIINQDTDDGRRMIACAGKPDDIAVSIAITIRTYAQGTDTDIRYMVMKILEVIKNTDCDIFEALDMVDHYADTDPITS